MGSLRFCVTVSCKVVDVYVKDAIMPGAGTDSAGDWATVDEPDGSREESAHGRDGKLCRNEVYFDRMALFSDR